MYAFVNFSEHLRRSNTTICLCEININSFLSNGSKQMPIMPRYNSCLPVSRTVASNYQEENVLFV